MSSYGAKGAKFVCTCVAHNECEKLTGVCGNGDASYTLEESGVHTIGDKEDKRVGVPHALKREVDAIQSGGAGLRKCLLELTRQYKNNPVMTALLPTETQLKNRKAYLRKCMEGMRW
ncbi:hypothetical protein PINS_up009443 [Pythium insidiosum]|nr:hypothetical protein PINS_up009443 [Pythium insidiosum]